MRAMDRRFRTGEILFPRPSRKRKKAKTPFLLNSPANKKNR